MNTSKKEDKKNFKTGLYVTITSAIVLLLFYLLWKPSDRSSLSCLGVQSQLNDMIETAKKYKNKGFIVQEKEKLLKNLEYQLSESKKLNCGFPEKTIRTYFKF